MNPTQEQLNYTLRRVVYDALIAANAVEVLRTKNLEFPDVESYKILGLLMARNLNEFFLDTEPDSRHPHDIRVAAFELHWDLKTDERFKNVPFDEATSKRISRLVAHVVRTRQRVFRRHETLARVKPFVELAVEFITKCRKHDRAHYTGKCRKYILELNQVLARLGMSLVPVE